MIEYALKNPLLDYQDEGFQKMKRLKVGALFMEQGTGKTIVACALFLDKLNRGKVDHAIILCPCSVKENEKEELKKQLPNEVLGKITICGIETLSSSIRALAYLLNLAEQKRCYLMVDESLLIKNFFAKRSQNIQKIANKCSYRLILNGTPLSKNEADLFSQFYLLDWRILGYKSHWSFAQNHIVYKEDAPDKIDKCIHVDYITERIAPYTYQKKKAECLSLPPKKYDSHYFCMTQEQIKHYEEIGQMLVEELDEQKPETVYRLFTAMQDITSGKRVSEQKGADGKYHLVTEPFFHNRKDNPRLKALMDIITEEKTILFCRFKEEVMDLCEALKERYGEGVAVPFDGSIPMKKRMEHIKQFKKEATYLVANKGCASFGLNLQFCNRIIHYSNGWDLAVRLQSEDRIHRIGQDREAYITDILASHSIDIRIEQCIKKKETMLQAIKQGIGGQEKKSWLSNWIGIGQQEEIDDCERV